MYNIKHRVGIKPTAEEVYRLLTTDEGLSGGWTTEVLGAGAIGSIIRFKFDDDHHDMKVDEVELNKRVAWRCI